MHIGELARKVGVNPQTLRYYEGIGLLAAAERTSSGYRVYGEDDADRVEVIKAAQRLGMRLDESAEVLDLRDADQCPCSYFRGVLHEHADIDERIVELQRLRRQLVDVDERADHLAFDPDAVVASCPLIDQVRRQGHVQA